MQYTCNIRAIYVQNLRNPFCAYTIFQIVFACICKYMYVFIRKLYIYKHIPSKIVYACICMYVYVYARILTYIVSPTSLLVPILGKIVYERICKYICKCMYMYVSVCICMYVHVCARISWKLLEWLPAMRGPMPLPPKTVSQGGSQPAPLRASWGLRSFTFFRHRQHFCRLDLAHIPPPARVQSP